MGGNIYDDSHSTILTSPDGITWTSQTSGTTQALNGITYGNNTFVAIGGSTILTSSDSITWTSRTSGTTQVHLNEITYFNNSFVAQGIGYDPINVVLTSLDGITWTKQTSVNCPNVTNATYGNNTFVTTSGCDIFTSSDGITWTLRSSSVTNDELNNVAYGN